MQYNVLTEPCDAKPYCSGWYCIIVCGTVLECTVLYCYILDMMPHGSLDYEFHNYANNCTVLYCKEEKVI